MSLVIVETAADQPITPDVLKAADERVLPCLEERNVTWRYSLLSTDRYRMICTFDAPDAESVRQAYRKGGGRFSCIWSGTLIQPHDGAPARNSALLKVIEGTYPPISEDDFNATAAKTLTCYAERGLEWIQSYLSLDRTKVICELHAPDAESVRQVQRQLGIPFDRVWAAEVLQP